MKKPWSISTTVRNPDRLKDFLRTLKELEGQPFGSENQIKYQILLIKNKLYKPTKLTKAQEEYFIKIENEMPFSEAQKIFISQIKSQAGRNSVALSIKVIIAKNSAAH